MSLRPLLACALAVLVVAVAPLDASAQEGGGMPAPGPTGGAQYGQAPSERPQPLTVRSFRISPTTIPAGAGSARVSFRVDGGAPQVRVRFSITAVGEPTPLHAVVLHVRPGRRYTRQLALPADRLAAGRYDALLQVGDARNRGRALRAHGARTRVGLSVAAPATAPPPAAPVRTPTGSGTGSAAPVSVPAHPPVGGVFPVRGPYSFGGAGARFGSDRGGRLHRGQDVLAAEGTPLVAPHPGTVHVRAYQGGGAGHYLVVRGADRRDYVFMHMREASPLAPGAPVAAGAPIGHVGNTGSSTGAHLHFEIWPNGWYASEGSQPVDPLPELLAWAGA